MTASEADRILHRRLLDGDPTATAEAAEQFLAPVALALQRRFPKLKDNHWADEAAAVAVYELLTIPGRYDPDKSGLLAYLTMSATGDLKNRLAAERRHSARRRDVAVELLADVRNKTVEDDEPLQERLTGLFMDPCDLEAAMLMLSGVRSTSRYAEVFGLISLPIAEQRKVVKRHKDRIAKILKRHGAEAL
jgi:RNA polymerase sigma-70 factor (ECF subfamily)